MNIGLRIVDLPGGRRALVVDHEIPDGAPETVREGLARRRIVNSGGACPCGAVLAAPSNRQMRRALRANAGEIVHVRVEHEQDCPAIDPAVIAYLETAKRGEQP